VGSFGHSVVISSKSSGTDQYIADAGFAGIAGSVMTAEPLYQHADEVGFTVEENPILRDKNMVEDDKGFMTSELAVANIDVPLGHDRTFGEFPSDEKNKISHRANALIRLRELLCQENEQWISSF
jgi:hypothetical protein